MNKIFFYDKMNEPLKLFGMTDEKAQAIHEKIYKAIYERRYNTHTFLLKCFNPMENDENIWRSGRCKMFFKSSIYSITIYFIISRERTELLKSHTLLHFLIHSSLIYLGVKWCHFVMCSVISEIITHIRIRQYLTYILKINVLICVEGQVVP